MADAESSHPTAYRRRRQKGPPTLPQAPLPRVELAASDAEKEHSDDSAGEKEAKRQRSEPTTPVSTSSRQPWEYDAIMGITRVGAKEAERFEEDLDSTEYHDATEEPTRKEESEEPQSPLKPGGIPGGFGSSSLKECIELLNATVRNSPAPLDSGVGQETTVPSQSAMIFATSSDGAECSDCTDSKRQKRFVGSSQPACLQFLRGSALLRSCICVFFAFIFVFCPS